MLPRDQFEIFDLENFDGPLCTGRCKKLVYMAEILVPLSVLRYPARFFSNKRCSFDVTDFEKTLLVTLYVSTHFLIFLFSPVNFLSARDKSSA